MVGRARNVLDPAKGPPLSQERWNTNAVPPIPPAILLNFLAKAPLKFHSLSIFFVAAQVFLVPALAQPDVALPNHFDPRERLELPDLSEVDRVRFLTTTDFPPFNFLDEAGRLAGFHVDLVRALCETLNIEPRCEIQALPWSELKPALMNGQGEVIAAGIAVTDANRQELAFSRPFMKLPARFVERAETTKATLDREASEILPGKRVGVMAGSAHEAMLRTYFPRVKAVPFARPELMFGALKQEDVAAVFGDGVRLSFWLGSDVADDCCRFLDGPFFSSHFLGKGLALAVAPEDAALAAAFDHALLTLANNGRFAEIYLRYFPQGLY